MTDGICLLWVQHIGPEYGKSDPVIENLSSVDYWTLF